MRSLVSAAVWTSLGAGGTILALGSLAAGLGASTGPQAASAPAQIADVGGGPGRPDRTDGPDGPVEPYDSALFEHVIERTTGPLAGGSTGVEPSAESLDALVEEAEEFDAAELEQVRDQLRSLGESMRVLDTDAVIDFEAIELADHEELSYVRAAFFDYATFSAAVDALALIVEDPTVADVAYDLLERDPWKYSGRVQDAVLDAAALVPAAFPTTVPNLTPLIPSPEPATPQPLPDEEKRDEVSMSPTPGIDADWPSDTDEGLWPPDYPTDIGTCIQHGATTKRPDEVIGLILRIVNGGFEIADAVLSALCKFEAEALGNSSNVARCIAQWLVATARSIPQAIQEDLDRCENAINAAELEAAFQNTQRILARMKSHEASMRQSMYTSDLYLRDIQVFNERIWIEENLASVDDDPDVLLMLPSSSCRPLLGDPTILYEPDGPERQRCGKIEVVRRIVEDTISMVEESGEGINNAEAEYDAAVEHLTAGRYRDAYLRFRKAYREAVSTRGPR